MCVLSALSRQCAQEREPQEIFALICFVLARFCRFCILLVFCAACSHREGYITVGIIEYSDIEQVTRGELKAKLKKRQSHDISPETRHIEQCA